MTTDTLIDALSDTGCSWHMQDFPHLERDEEFDFAPRDHFQVSIIVSYEDEIEGRGPTFADAARDALAQMTEH